MVFGKDGGVISSVTGVGESNLGRAYIVMWDNDGVPIHIKRDVVEYLYSNVYTLKNTNR